MKPYLITTLVVLASGVSALLIHQRAQAQKTSPSSGDNTSGVNADTVARKTDHEESSPIFVTEIPAGYRDWKLISVAREEGDLDDIRAVLGNDVAIEAYRNGKLQFPEGSIIARLAWSYLSSEENNRTFGRAQSFVAGSPKNGVQFMIKDSTKYAHTGGWGYGHFDDGKSANSSVLNSCFTCHEAVKERDFVFTRYAP